MDVIAVQASNKILKKMNTEFNGIYTKVTATTGQKVFDLPKEYAPGTNTMLVFVDGVLAILDTDYLETDNDTITFVEGLDSTNEVLFKTNVVGIPKIVFPPYDDVAVKADILQAKNNIAEIQPDLTQVKTDLSQARIDILNINGTLSSVVTTFANKQTQIDDKQTQLTNHQTQIDDKQTQINAIKTALDEDNDGSIVDTISNIKTQWETADGNLNTLINQKASNASLVIQKDRIDQIESNAVGTNNTIASHTTQLSEASTAIDAIESDVGLLQGTTISQGNSVVALQTEITNAKGTSTTLVEELGVIKLSIPLVYNDTTLVSRISNTEVEITGAKNGKTSMNQRFFDIEESITNLPEIPAPYDPTALTERIGLLEAKELSSFSITDTVTGWLYKIKLVNGVLTPELIKKLANVVLNRIGSGLVYKGDVVQFSKSATYEDLSEATLDTVFSFSVNPAIATINPTTGELTTMDEGGVTITVTGTNKGTSKQASVFFTIVLTDTQTVVKVKGLLDLAAASGGADLANVTGNLNLETSKAGTTIVWTSSDAAIGTDGFVTRPLFGAGNVIVTLTATITCGVVSDTKVFPVTVLALPE